MSLYFWRFFMLKNNGCLAFLFDIFRMQALNT